ncbi:putative uncharacterized protein DDB_G0272456 [Wyeomyia smithii]|uniref:putative uncharacterized protein DDB_G0272456 n=1 Tax=Wyeomyia smithii TaxID=174621 RepID=UPI002467F5C8|nr:putative uncharacterized protein DDB_G0272456 [Wyeomyia smithii]XP_055537561.1 putative uncharacterized protein DDB_G0272456 [Wyeomyia smithii]
MDQQSGSGKWQQRPEASFVPLRAPKGLSVDAPEFVPKQQQPTQYNPSQPQQQLQQRYRVDNNGAGGGGGGGGGGGTFNMVPNAPQYSQQHDMGNGALVNGTEMISKSNLSDRLKNIQISNVGPQQQQPFYTGYHGYNDNKDMRNPSHYNHHQHHPNQHYSQPHSQQQRLQQQQQQQQHHNQQQQQQQPPHMALHQNAAGHYPFTVAGMGYSSTALNNHLHHPILGGMAAAAVGGHGPVPMHENRVRARLQNAQNSQHHHQQQSHHQPHHHQQQQHHQHQQQQQHHHHRHHQQHMRGGAGNDYGGEGDAEQINENETLALEYLTEVIAELYDNPGMFENIQRKLKGTFAEFRNNHFVLSNAVEMIFEQSIKEQNFRYMGARLCHLLDSLDGGPESVLRQLLSMKIDHQHSELSGFMQNEQIKVRGTTLFLAELYMQLRKPQDAKRNAELARRITGAANILLSKEGPGNIKCVCQCLKLCGFELQRDCRLELMEIIDTLSSLEHTTDCSTGRFIRTVLELQQKSWGRNEEVVPVVLPSVSEATGEEFTDSPVFYGPDGQVMTEEENDFLETAAPVAFEEFDEDGDPDDLVDDENMDMEIKMAFKDFVASSKNRQPY